VALVVVACTPRAPREPVVTPREGITIAIYGGAAAVVEDVRWVDVAGGAIVLDRIERDVPLSAVAIEPLGRAALRIGACVRERLDGLPPSPLVRCGVTAKPGRHLVRVLHVASVGFETAHVVSMTTPDRATIATRFAIRTPAWRARAHVTLFDRAPGGTEEPRELARAELVLDGGTSVIARPAREVAARLRRIYDGMIPDATHRAHDLAWGQLSHGAVWVWLEVDARVAELPAGVTHAHVAIPGEAVRDARVPAAGRERFGETVRWPLWIDEDLWGRRTRSIDRADGERVTDRVQLAVFNGGETPREVWIEERLRPARSLLLTQWRPAEPAITRTRARRKVVVAPGATERLSFVVDYGF